MRKLWRSPYNWYLAFLITINILPLLAPIFLELSRHWAGFEWPAKAIYFVYSFTCHQLHHRSLHIYDHQCAWCTRDVAIWGAMLVVAVMVRKWKLKGIKWYWVIPFVIPIALDGGIQTIATLLAIEPSGISGAPLYVSSNLSRFITGAIFGIGLSLWLSPMLWRMTVEEMGQQAGESATQVGKFLNRNWKVAAVALAVMLGLYVVFVQMWRVSSPTYPPTDFLDSAVRTPATDFFNRRETAICPGTEQDLIQFQCFWGSD